MRALGLVAQLVEQRIENPCVGGSIPPRATRNISARTPTHRGWRSCLGIRCPVVRSISGSAPDQRPLPQHWTHGPMLESGRRIVTRRCHRTPALWPAICRHVVPIARMIPVSRVHVTAHVDFKLPCINCIVPSSGLPCGTPVATLDTRTLGAATVSARTITNRNLTITDAVGIAGNILATDLRTSHDVIHVIGQVLSTN